MNIKGGISTRLILVVIYNVYVYTIYMKRSVVYPAWAEKYRQKGRTLRKVRNGYGLYACSSVYVKGQKYPKSVQMYLGMITEKDGFIPKVVHSSEYLEYGLSHMILSNFKRDLERATYSGQIEIVSLGIVLFIFDGIDPCFIRSSWILREQADNLIAYSKRASMKRIKAVSNKIHSLLAGRIPDPAERNIVIQLLRLCVLEKTAAEPKNPFMLEEVRQILERNGLKP